MAALTRFRRFSCYADAPHMGRTSWRILDPSDESVVGVLLRLTSGVRGVHVLSCGCQPRPYPNCAGAEYCDWIASLKRQHKYEAHANDP